MSTNARAGKAYLFGVGMLIFLAGSVFFALMWRSYQRGREMAEWPHRDAVVLVSEVEERQIGPDVAPDFRLKLLFGYEVDGKPYTSGLLSLRGSPWSSDRAKAEEAVARFPLGSTLVCQYDPADPHHAVVKTDTKAVGYAIWFPGIFIVGGLGIMLRVMISGRR